MIRYYIIFKSDASEYDIIIQSELINYKTRREREREREERFCFTCDSDYSFLSSSCLSFQKNGYGCECVETWSGGE